MGITLFKVPIGEQNQRRWQSMNQLETPAWSDFLYKRHARFIQIALQGAVGSAQDHRAISRAEKTAGGAAAWLE
ncbi:hypothetical protein [Klebsiella variicola]|uniref:hypothetical protein n=1 Tax=Klebsiella variicola TaxID=244366 RepID=UPI00388EDA2C